jgi:hypothetical protein
MAYHNEWSRMPEEAPYDAHIVAGPYFAPVRIPVELSSVHPYHASCSFLASAIYRQRTRRKRSRTTPASTSRALEQASQMLANVLAAQSNPLMQTAPPRQASDHSATTSRQAETPEQLRRRSTGTVGQTTLSQLSASSSAQSERDIGSTSRRVENTNYLPSNTTTPTRVASTSNNENGTNRMLDALSAAARESLLAAMPSNVSDPRLASNASTSSASTPLTPASMENMAQRLTNRRLELASTIIASILAARNTGELPTQYNQGDSNNITTAITEAIHNVIGEIPQDYQHDIRQYIQQRLQELSNPNPMHRPMTTLNGPQFESLQNPQGEYQLIKQKMHY